jgi:hypothetical protein
MIIRYVRDLVPVLLSVELKIFVLPFALKSF